LLIRVFGDELHAAIGSDTWLIGRVGRVHGVVPEKNLALAVCSRLCTGLRGAIARRVVVRVLRHQGHPIWRFTRLSVMVLRVHGVIVIEDRPLSRLALSALVTSMR